MHYPFSEREKYFSPRELKHITEFIAFLPMCKTVYTNKAGEERMPLKVTLPIGCKTDQTCYIEDGDGNVFYHTPLAKLTGVLGDIYYQDVKTGECAAVDSVQWLKWLGQSHQERESPPPPKTGADKYTAAMKEVVKAGGKKLLSRKEFDAEVGGDKAKWRSVTTNKKTP